MPIKIQQQKAVRNTQYQSAVQAADKRVICDKGIPGSSAILSSCFQDNCCL